MRCRFSLLLALLLSTAWQPCSAQTAPLTDLELTGRVIGPLPVQPGRNSRFLLTARNLGPGAVNFTSVWATWPYDGSGLDLVPQNGPLCYAFREIDADPPVTYGLVVGINVPLAPGQSAACEFELRVDQPLPTDASIRFEAYANGNLNPAADVDFGNNIVTFPLGQAIVASIPATGISGKLLLAFVLLAAVASRRSFPSPATAGEG